MILVILVDLSSPMICAKIRPQGLLGSGEEDIYRFLPYMGMGPFWSRDRNHFSSLEFPCLKEALQEIWATLAQRLQRRSHLKFSKCSHTIVRGPYKCIGKQTWHCRKKKCQRIIIVLATLVDLLSPRVCVKIQHQSILGSGEEDF